MIRSHIPRLILSATAVLVLFPGVAAYAETVVRDGVPHVLSGATPAEGTATMTLIERWRVGGEDDEIFFGDVERVITDDQGNLYMVDSDRCCVQVYGPDGEHLRTLSREGDGPGEVREPYDVCLLPGGILALPRRTAGAVVRLGVDGVPASNWRLNENYTSINTVMYRGGNLVLAGQYAEPAETGQRHHYILARHGLDGAQQHVYVEGTNEFSFTEPFVLVEKNFHCARQGTCALGPDGRVYAASQRNEYRIDVYRPDGVLDRVIERAWKPLLRTDEEIARVRARMEDDVRNVPLRKELVIDTAEPVIGYLYVDEGGNLWVQHDRSDRDQPEGVMQTFDVFDPEGGFMRSVAVACDGDFANDILRFVDDGRLVLLKWGVGGSRVLDEDVEVGPLEVVLLERAP